MRTSLARAACMAPKKSVFLPLDSRPSACTADEIDPGACTRAPLAPTATLTPVGGSSETGVPHDPQKRKPVLMFEPQTLQTLGGSSIGCDPAPLVGFGIACGTARFALDVPVPEPVADGDGDAETPPLPALALALATPPPSSDRTSPHLTHEREPIALKVRHPSQTSPTSIARASVPPRPNGRQIA